jgi:hypothetical protein
MHGLTGGSWKRSRDHRASFLPYSERRMTSARSHAWKRSASIPTYASMRRTPERGRQ